MKRGLSKSLGLFGLWNITNAWSVILDTVMKT